MNAMTMSVRFLWSVLLMLCLATSVFAQEATTGAITGRVLDSSGAVLPGVTISLKGSEGAAQFSGVTDGQGVYRLTNLPPAIYDVRIELTGFESITRQAVVRINAVTALDFTLVIGSQRESVQVTARKRPEDLQKVPQSIAASTADELEAASVQRLSDLGQVTPNLLYGQKVQSGSSAGLIYIRGIGQQDTNVAFSPGVGVYVDGVYLGRAQATDLEMADVERVEVLYGPQGTLFGKNSNGGAINVVTKRPDLFATSPRATVEAQSGAFGRLDVRGAVNLPLAANRAALQVSGAGWRQDGYSTRTDGQDQANQDRFAGRVQLLLKPKEKFEALLRVDATTFNEHSAAYKLVAVRETSSISALYASQTPFRYDNRWVTPSDYTYEGTGPNKNAGSVWGTSLNLTWQRPWGTLTSITAFRRLHVEGDLDPDGSPLTVADVFNPVDQHQLSQETQAIGTSFSGRLRWVTGLYLFRENAQDIESIDIAVEFFHGAANLSYNNYVVNSSYAGYGQATFDLTDKLKTTVGGRLGHDDVDGAREQVGHPVPIVQQPLVRKLAGWTSFLPRVGLDYQWTSDLMTYVSVAKGSKNGGFNGRAASVQEFNLFEPERVWAYELGVRSEWLHRRVHANASVFYSDYRDFQIQQNESTTDPATGQPVAFSFVGNMPKARVTGGEFSLYVVPRANLKLSAGLGIADGKYVTVIPGAPVTTDSQFVNTPKYTVTTAADYSRTLGTAGQLAVRVDYIHKSRIHYDYGNSPLIAQDPYGLLNARLTWQPHGSPLSLFLFGTNLTGVHYAVGGIDDGPTGSIGEVLKLMGPPREWGVGARLVIGH
jgi:iron complex outermembrane recepter protein